MLLAAWASLLTRLWHDAPGSARKWEDIQPPLAPLTKASVLSSRSKRPTVRREIGPGSHAEVDLDLAGVVEDAIAAGDLDDEDLCHALGVLSSLRSARAQYSRAVQLAQLAAAACVKSGGSPATGELNLGQLALRHHRYKAAEQHFEASLRESALSDAAVGLSWSLLLQGQLERAEAALELGAGQPLSLKSLQGVWNPEQAAVLADIVAGRPAWPARSSNCSTDLPGCAQNALLVALASVRENPELASSHLDQLRVAADIRGLDVAQEVSEWLLSFTRAACALMPCRCWAFSNLTVAQTTKVLPAEAPAAARALARSLLTHGHLLSVQHPREAVAALRQADTSLLDVPEQIQLQNALGAAWARTDPVMAQQHFRRWHFCQKE